LIGIVQVWGQLEVVGGKSSKVNAIGKKEVPVRYCCVISSKETKQ
jgi:hypothetical protein